VEERNIGDQWIFMALDPMDKLLMHWKIGRGRPSVKPIIKPDKDLKLAQTHKYREKGRVVKVSKEIIFGDEKEIEEIRQKSPFNNRINTSFIERSNGTFRTKISRIVRQSYSFSKNKEMHESHITIYAVYYNLI
jgi:hypothetical protein